MKTLDGFKDFMLRGNLIELAVAVIMGTTFGAVVKAFTDMLLDIIGKFGGVPDFSGSHVWGINFGAFLSALMTFVLTGLVVYFFIIVPTNRLAKLKDQAEEPAAGPSTEELLTEIRDLLKEGRIERQP